MPTTTLFNIFVLAGGVGIIAHGEIVGAIGVGGAPGGEKHEECTLDCLAAIVDRLPK